MDPEKEEFYNLTLTGRICPTLLKLWLLYKIKKCKKKLNGHYKNLATLLPEGMSRDEFSHLGSSSSVRGREEAGDSAGRRRVAWVQRTAWELLIGRSDGFSPNAIYRYCRVLSCRRRMKFLFSWWEEGRGRGQPSQTPLRSCHHSLR